MGHAGARADVDYPPGIDVQIRRQAAAHLESTGSAYQKDTGRRFADRDDFDDAIDFVGWYTHNTHRAVGISKWDPYNQYLAYHEGATGWKRGTYKRKGWLKDTARRVDYRAREWGAQLQRCEDDLDTGWWIFGRPRSRMRCRSGNTGRRPACGVSRARCRDRAACA